MRNLDFGCSLGRHSKAPTARSVLVRVCPSIHPRLVGPSGTSLQGRIEEIEKEWDQNRGQDTCIVPPSPRTLLAVQTSKSNQRTFPFWEEPNLLGRSE